jgi:hypothetical protein
MSVMKALLFATAFVFASPLSSLAVTTYTLESGTLTLTVDEYANGRLYRAADTVKIAIDSAMVMLDPDTAELTLLDLQASPFVDLALYPSTPSYRNDTYRTLVIDAFGVHATDGALVGSGAGFTFSSGVSVDATVGGVGGYGPVPSNPAVAVIPGQLGTGSIYGDLGSGNAVTVSGVARGFYESPFNDSRFVVTGNFNLIATRTAAIPEPGSVVLFLTGLGVASLAGRGRGRGRRKRSAIPR